MYMCVSCIESAQATQAIVPAYQPCVGSRTSFVTQPDYNVFVYAANIMGVTSADRSFCVLGQKY